MGATGPAGAAGAGPGRPQASIDFRRLGVGDLVAGGALVVLFVSLFLPWYSIGYGGVSASTSAMGSGAGGWRVLVLVLALLTIGYLLVRTVLSTVRLPIPHWQFLTVLTVVVALLTLLAFLVKPGVDTTGLGTAGIGTSWSYGAYIGLVAAVAAVGGAVQRSRQSDTIEPKLHAAGRPAPSPFGSGLAAGHGHGGHGFGSHGTGGPGSAGSGSAVPGSAGSGSAVPGSAGTSPAVLQGAPNAQGPWPTPGASYPPGPQPPGGPTPGPTPGAMPGSAGDAMPGPVPGSPSAAPPGPMPGAVAAGPCGACGAPLVPGNQFCVNCGTRHVP
ncbi:MAG: zinc ribbon domain-containing protein [Actinomycetota bacterium]|nr:zinc ribbon domain-containing protein [Actinomycetota bacterium]